MSADGVHSRRPAAAPLDLDDLVRRVRAAEPRALGRAISLLEDGRPQRRELVARLFSETGRARVIGITGPPGAGKSTLVDCLAHRYRERDERVGILAIDPTSPYSGGAILGDRIRMQKLYTDPGTFIRSMATRGAMGGLARATLDAVDVLDAAGFDRILVETVGVGQDEVDVVRGVDTVVLVTLPGLGDDIQAIKAGIMEIADVFAVNKADREGADRAARDLEMVLGLAEVAADWRPPIVKTVASRREGIEALAEAISAHRRFLEDSGELETRRRSHLRLRVENVLKDRVLAAAEEVAGLDREVESGFERRLDPYTIADRLFSEVVAHEGGAR